MRVSYPCDLNSLIDFSRIFNALRGIFVIYLNLNYYLISGLIVAFGVEIFSTISSSDQMNHSIVSFVSQIHGTPSLLIKDDLPILLTHIGIRVHHTSVAQYHSWFVCQDRKIGEIILQSHLHLHELCLKPKKS